MIRNVLIAVIVVFASVSLLELAGYISVTILIDRGFAYQPPEIDESFFEHYLRTRDPLVEWPKSGSRTQDPFDQAGARISPAFPDAHMRPCVSTFGDSFTFGAQVGPENAYPNKLSYRLNCRVNNFGVSGYGTDQSLLTFRTRIDDGAKVLVLGYYSDNILRNVNRYRNFLVRTNGIGLKPRFILDNNQLKLLPIYTPLSAEALTKISENPANVRHEYFFPNGPAGTIEAGFPHLMVLAQLVRNWRVKAKLVGTVTYGPFYHPQHPSGGLKLTTAILTAFYNEALQREQKPIILFMPDETDLSMAKAGDPLPYQPLIDALTQEGIDVLDVSSNMLEFIKHNDVCDLYVNCDEHYTIAGYDLVADVVYDWIVKHRLL